MSKQETIRLRNVTQNNLRGFDLELPIGKLIVVTGLSGAGKSSLAFDTLHAEGQRRYVETFSSYARQFLERLDKPRVDAIDNIRPSIAIGQTGATRTSRSSVGTMTELCDYFKVWWTRAARLHDPATGEPIEDDNPRTIWRKALERWPGGRTALVAFAIEKPKQLTWPEILRPLSAQGYTRAAYTETAKESPRLWRIEELDARASSLPKTGELLVVQDRIALESKNQARFFEAAREALRFGRGAMRILDDNGLELGRFSAGLHSPITGRRFRPAAPSLFSFNSPIGACPRCRGFGRIIEVDPRLVIPDESLTIREGVIRPFQGKVYSESLRDLIRSCAKHDIPVDVPWNKLSEKHRSFVLDGETGYGTGKIKWPRAWYGVKHFFTWLEGRAYRMHVRVFLSRFRTYTTCPDCGGARLQPESLMWKWRGRTLPDLYRLTTQELLALLETPDSTEKKISKKAALDDPAFDGILTRLRYLCEAGLGYLSLDRQARTLSGGESRRVALATCLGASLVETIFVLDEPSVGLHPRDIARLASILTRLANQGNTVVVVEHDEDIMRAAEHLVEIGPGPGEAGGRVVFNGPPSRLASCPDSLTSQYLLGRAKVVPPEKRRPVEGSSEKKALLPRLLRLEGVTLHNLHGLDVSIPLGRLVGLCGVSGSGKSTLLEHALHQGLLARRGQPVEEPAHIARAEIPADFSDIVLVDQSSASRTPRSSAVIYTGAWDGIRKLFAESDAARAAGFDASYFSFNSGQGRCPHCEGLGSERVEMQFMSDLHVPCPVCSGKRFRPEVLACAWNGLTVDAVLSLEATRAVEFFSAHPRIAGPLRSLISVGLGYLPLGRPLNTLSGGESQRLKLVRYLGGLKDAAGPSLLLLDEPTTGLHRADVKRLIEVLQRLVDNGHSVVVVEHQTDILAACDWLIELGPEAGDNGGRIVAAGTPEHIARLSTATAPFVARALSENAPGYSKPSRKFTEKTSSRSHPSDVLRISGAREHNLKNLSVTLPRREFAVITGVSGSGKSTLAFDIVFAEGQRRFMESMSAYARQFVEQLPRPEVDAVTGIPPTVAIEQRVTRGGRKSTVATVTEVAPHLRLLYARLGVQHSPVTGKPLEALPLTEVARHFRVELRKYSGAKHLGLFAPLVRGRKGHHQPLADWAEAHGYARLRCDGRIVPVEKFQKMARYREHDVEVEIADFGMDSASRPQGAAATLALESALKIGKGACFLLKHNGGEAVWFSTSRTDPATGESYPDPAPNQFSWNSPRGWCPTCRGHGIVFEETSKDDEEDIYAEPPSWAEGVPCPDCKGARLNPISCAVKLRFKNGSMLSLPELLALKPAGLLMHLKHLKLDARGRAIAAEVLPRVAERLNFLDHVGLNYLALDRSAETLAGGEAQRIRLAAQLGSNLSGVLYVLDEPSIGLHARDNRRLIASLRELQSRDNSLLVVEHDEETLLQADRILDLGPGAGIHGGNVVANGTVKEILNNPDSLTGKFLREGLTHPRRGEWRKIPPCPKAKAQTPTPGWLSIHGASLRNLKNCDVSLPLGRLIAVCGPSGAGKSTLVREIIAPAAAYASAHRLARLDGDKWAAKASLSRPLLRHFLGGNALRRVVEVGQDPIGSTPRSTPATYTGAFDHIRAIFAQLPDARMRGLQAGWFSYNTKGGRCDTCAGAGRVRLEMNFMPEAWVPCEECGGDRYGPQALEMRWNGKNPAEVLRMSFEEAAAFFAAHRKLKPLLDLMVEAGLGYLTLGQSSPTLSGGEAQRLKLVTELAGSQPSPVDIPARFSGRAFSNLYILEEPTIGLHQSDVARLIDLLHRLVDRGDTVIVIEHHLDLIAEADWAIELGPDGGDNGGRILYQGPVTGLAARRDCPTAPFLRPKLKK